MISKFPELNDYEWLYQRYRIEDISMTDIAKMVGCGVTTVFRATKSHNIHIKKYPELSNKKWLYQKYIIDMNSAMGIADIMGCESSVVYKALKKHGIKTRSLSEAQSCKNTKFPELFDKEWLHQKYCIERLSHEKIAELLGCKLWRIKPAMNKFGIKRIYPIHYKELADYEWLHNKYIVDGLSTREIADILNCAMPSILAALQKHGIKIRTPDDMRPQKLNDGIWLKKKYIDEMNSSVQIANLLNCSDGAVAAALDRHNIKRRTLKEAVSGKFNHGWLGGISFEPYCHKFTEEVRERVRDKFGRKCLLCPKTEKEQMYDQIHRGKQPKQLSVHHTNYNKNCGCDDTKCILVPLCIRCHAKTNYDRDFWENEIMAVLNTQYPHFVDV